MNQIDWHNFLFWPAPLAGLALCGLGCLGILAPAFAGRAFGLPTSGPALPYLPPLGARDLALGISVLGLCAQGEVRPLTILILSLVVVAVADGVAVFRHGDRRLVIVHGAGALGAALYGGWLWFQ